MYDELGAAGKGLFDELHVTQLFLHPLLKFGWFVDLADLIVEVEVLYLFLVLYFDLGEVGYGLPEGLGRPFRFEVEETELALEGVPAFPVGVLPDGFEDIVEISFELCLDGLFLDIHPAGLLPDAGLVLQRLTQSFVLLVLSLFQLLPQPDLLLLELSLSLLSGFQLVLLF